MSEDQDKAARALKAAATKAANAAKRNEAMNEIVNDLRVKYPHLDQPELEKLAKNQMKKRALDRQDQMVLNPRVNAKVETRRKVIVGAMLITDAEKSAVANRLLRGYVAGIKETDQKLFADILAKPTPPASALIERLAGSMIHETLTEALEGSAPRFTLTFNRDLTLLSELKKLIAA